MDDLARELGMSKKTLYGFFPSKIELLQAVMLQKIAEVEAIFEQEAKEKRGGFHEDLEALLARMGQISDEITPPFLRDLQRDAPELFTLIENRRRLVIHRHFTTMIERGRRRGTIRRDIPTSLMIEILLGATQAIVNPKKMVELGLTPKSAYTAVLRVVLEGVIVRTGKGRI
jgi:AcrR family transcriptional regulator